MDNYTPCLGSESLITRVCMSFAIQQQLFRTQVKLMSCRLPMCHQTNLRFYDDIAYDKQYKGLILGGFEGDLLLHVLLHIYLSLQASLCVVLSCTFSCGIHCILARTACCCLRM